MADGTVATPAAVPAGGAAPAPGAAAAPSAAVAGAAPAVTPAPQGGAQNTPVAGNGQNGGQQTTQGEGGEPASLLGNVQELQVKVPDGVVVDQELLAGFLGVAKEGGLKGEIAQKLVDTYVAALKRHEQAWEQTWKKQWVDELKADKEFGGANYQKTEERNQRALQQFGDPDLVQWLNASGFCNHPKLVKLWARIGASLEEDSIAGAAAAPSGHPPTEEQLLRSWFNNPKSQSMFGGQSG